MIICFPYNFEFETSVLDKPLDLFKFDLFVSTLVFNSVRLSKTRKLLIFNCLLQKLSQQSQFHQPFGTKCKCASSHCFERSIVKIDSITWSFCLLHYVQNGLSYLGKETRPTVFLKGRQARLGIISLGTNKDHLLHRIQSVQTFTNLQYRGHYLASFSFTNKTAPIFTSKLNLKLHPTLCTLCFTPVILNILC